MEALSDLKAIPHSKRANVYSFSLDSSQISFFMRKREKQYSRCWRVVTSSYEANYDC